MRRVLVFVAFTALCGAAAALHARSLKEGLADPPEHLWCVKGTNNLCDPYSPQSRNILITGAPGSGTRSVASLFDVNGIRLKHESVGQVGSVSWPYAVNSAQVWSSTNSTNIRSCAWLTPPKVTFTHVYQLLRCPIRSMSAMLNMKSCSHAYLRETLGILEEAGEDGTDQRVRFTGRTWLRLQEHLEKYVEKRFTIYEMKTMFLTVCQDAGFPAQVCNKGQLPEARESQRHHKQLTWRQLRQIDGTLAKNLQEKALSYGFGRDCLEDDYNQTAPTEVPKANTVVLKDIPGARCSGDACDDGLEWVWEQETLHSFLKARKKRREWS